MDKKILERAAYDVDNGKLEKAIEDYTASNNDVRKLGELMKIFRESQVIVPVAFPKKVEIRVLEKMLRGEPLGEAGIAAALLDAIRNFDRGPVGSILSERRLLERIGLVSAPVVFLEGRAERRTRRFRLEDRRDRSGALGTRNPRVLCLL